MDSSDLDGICKAEYVDSAFVLVDDVRSIQFDKIGKGYPDATVLVFVRKGFMHIDIDGNSQRVGTSHMLLSRPGRAVSHPSFSADFEGHAILLSSRFGHSIITTAGNLWKYLMQLDVNPVLTLPASTAQLLRTYYDLLTLEVRRSGNLYYNEVIMSIIRSLLYSVINDLRRLPVFEVLAEKDYARNYEGSPRALTLFHRFIEILESEPCTHRSIRHYAERLCVTPKYLSTVCRHISGRTAREWICDAMVNAIESHLRYGDKSIKEIAVMYGFPGLSVFSKFVKAHLGVPPTRLRDRP